jgi:hypothetical protein
VSLSARTIKLASITQNNHVYEHTAEGPTPEMSLNIRSPYRRQKRDLSIIRSSFRRPHTRVEIPAINTLPSSRSHQLLPTFLPPPDHIDCFLPSCHIIDFFLPSCDRIDYFLPSYLLAITSTTSYLPTFLRPHRLLPIFLPSCHIIDFLLTFLRPYRLFPNFLPSYLLATTPTTPFLLTFLRPYRLLPTFLLSCDHINYFLISYFPTFLRSYRLSNNPYSLNQLKPR